MKHYIGSTSQSRRRAAFTLVELLVVIGIIGILIGILLPTLSQARMRAQRVVCASRIRTLAHVVHMYANENQGVLPTGIRSGDGQEHTMYVSFEIYDQFMRLMGSTRTTDLYLANPGLDDFREKQVACPNVEEQFPFHDGGLGMLLGYNYLGGHKITGEVRGWPSPLKLGWPGNPALFADLNDWSPPYVNNWTMVPHRKAPGGGYFRGGPGAGLPPDDPFFRATGGNVARLDGSVEWRHITDMKKYSNYAYPTSPPEFFMAMW